MKEFKLNLQVSSEHHRVLLSVADYREFILKAVELQSRQGRLNFAAFSRKAGFSSRSFPRDVVFKKRNMTTASLGKFIAGLKLRGDWKRYFEMLVALEHPDVVPGIDAKLDDLSKRDRLAELRLRLERKPLSKTTTRPIFHTQRRWLEIYASLGSLYEGASLSMIMQKTKLSENVCRSSLRQMIEAEFVRFDQSRDVYIHTQSQLILRDQGDNQFAESYFIESLNEAKTLAKLEFKSERRLCLNSVFSIDPERAGEFKVQLRELIEAFVDKAEHPNGSELYRVLVSFGHI